MSDENTNKLEWTGERYVPEISGAIRLEHVHRYLLAREISRDKRVLDIACGEGYGADLLASVASHVIGVDNAPHVVAHASRRYTRPNVEFIHGACEAIPLPDDSVDIVVSFETLEHVQRQHDMMQEIRRVLRADGLLMISNPERHEYSEVLGNSNPYHVSELYRDEFERLLRSHFKHVAVSGQRVQGGSLVAPLDASTSSNFVTFPASTDLNAPLAEQGIRAPVYLLAIASDIPLPTLPTGLLDGGDFAWAADLQGLQSQVQGQCTVEIARRFGEVIELEGASIADIRGAFNRQAERVSAAVSTMAASEEQRDQAQRRIRELELLTGTLIAELQHTRAHAETIENQLLEGNARLAAAHSDLTASRAIAKAHATAEEWLERKAHRLEAEIEVQRRSLALSEEQLAVARAQLSDVQRQLTASQVLQAASQDQLARLDAQRISSEARVAASHEKLAHLRSLIFSLQTQIEVYEQSRSWRLTAPLRAARRLGRATSRGASPISDLHQVLADESVEVASPSPGGPLAPGVVTRAAPAAVVESAVGPSRECIAAGGSATRSASKAGLQGDDRRLHTIESRGSRRNADQADRLLPAAVPSDSGKRRVVGQGVHRVDVGDARQAAVRRALPTASAGRARVLRFAAAGHPATPDRAGEAPWHSRVLLLPLLVPREEAAPTAARSVPRCTRA